MTTYKPARVYAHDREVISRSLDAVAESQRILALPYWPRDYFPPSCPDTVPTAGLDGEIVPGMFAAPVDPEAT